MRKHYIDVDSSWGVVFCYDFDYSDIDEMAAYMASLGASDRQIREAMNVLFGINGGMTISLNELKMSLVFVGNATSIEQFLDTTSHEIDHVQDAICNYYGIPLGSEDAAWTQGYLMREITRALRKDGTLC